MIVGVRKSGNRQSRDKRVCPRKVSEDCRENKISISPGVGQKASLLMKPAYSPQLGRPGETPRGYQHNKRIPEVRSYVTRKNRRSNIKTKMNETEIDAKRPYAYNTCFIQECTKEITTRHEICISKSPFKMLECYGYPKHFNALSDDLCSCSLFSSLRVKLKDSGVTIDPDISSMPMSQVDLCDRGPSIYLCPSPPSLASSPSYVHSRVVSWLGNGLLFFYGLLYFYVSRSLSCWHKTPSAIVWLIAACLRSVCTPSKNRV